MDIEEATLTWQNHLNSTEVMSNEWPGPKKFTHHDLGFKYCLNVPDFSTMENKAYWPVSPGYNLEDFSSNVDRNFANPLYFRAIGDGDNPTGNNNSRNKFPHLEPRKCKKSISTRKIQLRQVDHAARTRPAVSMKLLYRNIQKTALQYSSVNTQEKETSKRKHSDEAEFTEEIDPVSLDVPEAKVEKNEENQNERDARGKRETPENKGNLEVVKRERNTKGSQISVQNPDVQQSNVDTLFQKNKLIPYISMNKNYKVTPTHPSTVELFSRIGEEFETMPMLKQEICTICKSSCILGRFLSH